MKRVIVDECVGAQSVLMQRFRQSLAPAQPVEFVRLGEVHRAIPDVELLRRLLGPDTILLTMDRVLHNQVCDLGFRSYTLDAQGNLRRKKLPGIPTAKPVTIPRSGELKSDYVHPVHPLARALKQGMTERAFKRYQTRRRRIRSYFGSEANIASVSLTIGAQVTAKGSLCGYYLRLAGKSGVKGLQASEGYGISSASKSSPGWCVIHGLRELYLLQLETVPTQIYLIPPASLALCEGLPERLDCAGATADVQALHRLLKGLAAVEIFPCAKGPFFERMERKLQQLACSRSNEVVAVTFDRIISALNDHPALSQSTSKTDIASQGNTNRLLLDTGIASPTNGLNRRCDTSNPT